MEVSSSISWADFTKQTLTSYRYKLGNEGVAYWP